MSIGYGIKVKGFDDPYIANVEESIKGFNMAGIPGSFLVDLIPALKYVPNWFPGAGFKKKAAHWAQVNHNVAEIPFNHVAQQMVGPDCHASCNLSANADYYEQKEGIAGPSLAATLISALPEGDEKLLAEETKLAQNIAAVAYLGLFTIVHMMLAPYLTY